MKKNIKAIVKISQAPLNEREVALLKKQIQFNSKCIDRFIKVIDLLVNKEKCPKDANTLLSLRKRLQITLDESDTFRKVLWRHQQWISNHFEEDMDATSYLLSRIRGREQALIAQMAMK